MRPACSPRTTRDSKPERTAAQCGDPPRPAGQLAAVPPPRGYQRVRRRDGGTRAHGAPPAGAGRIRARVEGRDPLLPGGFRRGQGGREPARRPARRPGGAQAHPRGRMARRPARATAPDLGADVGMGGVRQRAAGREPGPVLVTTVIMKIDLVGPERRGLAMGLNEFAGYVAVSGAALLTGWIAARHGLRPDPFY